MLNPHKLGGGATYCTHCPFAAMSLAARIGGTVFRYSLGRIDGAFGYAVTKGAGAVLFNRHTMQPCDKNGTST